MKLKRTHYKRENIVFSVRYGIVHVDFDDASRKRTPKYSATWFKKLLKLRKLSLQYS